MPDLLLSLPPGMVDVLKDCEPRVAAEAFATCDPPGGKLGSGGGTSHVLAAAWRALAHERPFADWLAGPLKILVHSGGESRRLPAYAAPGKAFIPLPAQRWSTGQRLDQTLLDMQLPLLRRLAESASPASRLMIVSGDVLLRSPAALPGLPEADVVLLGLWATPQTAQHFGVMFCRRDEPGRLVKFLQKPSPDRILAVAQDYLFMMDVGVWLLSEKAVRCLMRRSGWDETAQAFPGGRPGFYEMYSDWGLHLGEEPQQPDDEIASLTTAVVPLPEGEFYHFGTSRDIINSVYDLQNLVVDQTKLGTPGGQPHPRQFVQNAFFDGPLRQEPNHTLWIENSHIPANWRIAREHVLTGIPKNDWTVRLEPGVCIDMVPVGEARFGLRVYGLDDAFRGALSAPETRWFGRPAAEWFALRRLDLAAAGGPDRDLQEAELFPVVEAGTMDPRFLEWLFAEAPEDNPRWRTLWLESRRLSSSGLTREVCLPRAYAQRRAHRADILPLLAGNYRRSIFYRLDLDSTAALYAESGHALPPPVSAEPGQNPLVGVHDRMFRAAVQRRRGDPGAAATEKSAFGLLGELLVESSRREPVEPRCTVQEDQIVWGRSPVRLDLAGGWTDTPPYCLEHGGQVVNMAVDLNGQPPIQVFARLREEPNLVIRSIDLGIEDRLTTYEQVGQYDGIGTGFAVARAALALAGFHPAFSRVKHKTLQRQLQAFGGGLELSMLSAVPKGSGLGTSSILAATLLGTLADLTGLEWDRFEIAQKTMALEQMLTSGGGWQDQLGGLLPGVKLIETRPGLDQQPVTRWLPSAFFEQPDMKSRMLLYYTGITRMAQNILGEVVRGIFLNRGRSLQIVEAIGRNAHFAYEAIQMHDAERFAEAVRRSWALNQALDAGTNVPGVQAILDLAGNDLSAAKLLGAGGGGYLLMVARSASSAQAIRERLQQQPPNAKARFVEATLSATGLQITRS